MGCVFRYFEGPDCPGEIEDLGNLMDNPFSSALV